MSGYKRGSFRGVAFFSTDYEGTSNPGNVIKQPPEAVQPIVDNVGRRLKPYQIQLFVIASTQAEYIAARDALIDALDAPGAAELIHPRYGTFDAAVQGEYTWRESYRTDLMAEFSVTFVQVNERSAQPTFVDSVSNVNATAAAVTATALATLELNYNVVGLAAAALDRITTQIDDALNAAETAVDDVVNDVTAVLLFPADIGIALVGTYNSIAARLDDPLDALALYTTIADNAALVIPFSGGGTLSADRIRELRSREAFAITTQATAIAAAADTSASATYSSSDVMQQNVALILQRIEALQTFSSTVDDAPIDDALFVLLDQLQADLQTDARVRGATLPRVSTVTTRATLPAVVLAHSIYGDATRDADVIDTNSVIHPLFVPANTTLEVLVDV